TQTCSKHLTASKWRPRELVVSVIRQTTCQGEKAEIQDASVPESGGALVSVCFHIGRLPRCLFPDR
ncbi:hypothetical protein ACLKA7_001263, partial [Drosophila subpalustris]